jgi:hypothetical protein
MILMTMLFARYRFAIWIKVMRSVFTVRKPWWCTDERRFHQNLVNNSEKLALSLLTRFWANRCLSIGDPSFILWHDFWRHLFRRTKFAPITFFKCWSSSSRIDENQPLTWLSDSDDPPVDCRLSIVDYWLSILSSMSSCRRETNLNRMLQNPRWTRW